MIDLSQVSGLPITLNDDNTLTFKKPLVAVKPGVRTFEEMKPVLKDHSVKPSSDTMYYMYRNVQFPDHEKIIADAKVSYDITVIPSMMVGHEFNKTQGHFHAVKEGLGIAYPEVYEVLNGHALFLLQKMDEYYNELLSVIAIEARTGDRVIFPPNYGHSIMNLGIDTLVTSNWVGTTFERMYKLVVDHKGMAYYVVQDPVDGFRFEANDYYGKVPRVRTISTKFMMNFEIMGNLPMYTIGTRNPKSLEFLNFPEKYAIELSSITS
jgi:glucose-6-phosphate isomerase, archaeal